MEKVSELTSAALQSATLINHFVILYGSHSLIGAFHYFKLNLYRFSNVSRPRQKHVRTTQSDIQSIQYK